MMHKIMYVNIKNIEETEGPFTPLDEERYNKLKESILQCGLIYPIVTIKTGTDRYKIVDGRNRFKVLSELGVDEVPVIILDQEELSTITSYDLELFRRHLEKEVIKLKEEERNNYLELIRKTIKRNIFKMLNFEETSVLVEKLEPASLKELAEIASKLQTLSAFTGELRKIGESIVRSMLNKGTISSDDIKKEIETAYKKILEERDRLLQEKEEEIFILNNKLEELEKEYENLKKEYQTLIESGKKIKEEIEKKIDEKYRRQIQELEAELAKARAEKIINNEESEKIMKKIVEQIKKEFEEEKRRYEAEISEWRNRNEELKKEILKQEKIKEELKAQLEKIKEEKERYQRERNLILTKMEDIKKILHKATDPDIIERHIENAKKSLEAINEILDKLNPYAEQTKKNRILNIFSDLRNYFNITYDKIKAWAEIQETFSTNTQEVTTY